MHKILTDSAAITATSVALLYCWSTAYYQAYLGAFDLTPGLLDRNFHQVLYHGLSIAFIPIAIALAIVSVLLMAYTVVSEICSTSRHVRRWRTWARTQLAPPPVLGSPPGPVNKPKKRAVATYVILLLATAFASTLAYAQNQGRHHGKQHLDRIRGGQIPTALQIQDPVGGKVDGLRLIACGARACAAMAPTTQRVYYFAPSGFSQRKASPP